MNGLGESMRGHEEAVLLRVFVSESDRYEGRPLYQAIILEARNRGLAGATAFKGFLGYGVHSRIHSARFIRSGDLPVMVEVVDTQERILFFLNVLKGMLAEGLATLERVEVIRSSPKAR